MNDRIEKYLCDINHALEQYIPDADFGEPVVSDAMQYSVSIGGKRIRPVLTLEFCRLCGGDVQEALPFACAVEMVHTYSLIHDDLPCMDDDDMRRGKPACHIKFGEDYALLAGDGLLTLAFETLTKSRCSSDKIVKAVSVLSRHAGYCGMIGGQTIDLKSEGRTIDVERLKLMDRLKTGRLIEAAALLGCIAGDADGNQTRCAKEYADAIGHAFQIVDDILDVTATAEELGKPIGSDGVQEKSTYVSLLGIEKSKALAKTLTDRAKQAAGTFGDEGQFLCELADSLLERNH